MKIKNLSASLLEKWDQCPLLCTAVYEKGIKEPPNEAAKFGSAIHETMETLVNETKSSFFGPPFEEVLPKMLEKHGVAARYKDAVPMVAQAIRWGYVEGLSCLVGVEQEFHYLLPDGTNVHGYIDRLDFDKTTGTLTVYDLKTGKQPTTEKLQKAWQTRIYNWAARKLIPEAVTCQVKYLYLRFKSISIPQTAADAAKAEVDMLATTKAIKESTEPQPKTGYLCPYCPIYQAKQCPAFVTIPDFSKYETKVENPPAVNP